jgi:Rrf2 family protein
MLNMKSRYAMRALLYLAGRHGEGPVQIGEIADAQRIPRKFLTVILSELSREGIIGTRRGRAGGYWLERAPSEISYGDIVRITRGSLALVPCASRLAYEPCDNCLPESECHLRLVMLAVRDATADVLDRLTLADPPPGEVALKAPAQARAEAQL